MVRIINQRELRNDNAAIMRALEDGESFIVTRNGTPIADLVPRQTAKRQAVPVSELLSVLAGGPRIDAEEFYADLDRYVDPDPSRGPGEPDRGAR
ncbi:MAG: type II toxin-antitoxin system Phd/YefM family antitoxin [Pseudonocardiaceae bacterium]